MHRVICLAEVVHSNIIAVLTDPDPVQSSCDPVGDFHVVCRRFECDCYECVLVRNHSAVDCLNQWYSTFFGSRNFPSTLYPQRYWCIIQVIRRLWSSN